MSRDTFVYFVKPVGLDGPIKIGCSDYPIGRVSALATWSPFPLELLVTIPGDLRLEASIHDHFFEHHSHREWFRANPELTALIETLKTGTPLEQIIALPAPTNKLRRGLRRPHFTEDRRLYLSYSQRVRHASLRLGSKVPKETYAIILRWTGWAKQPVITPTAAELAHLEEYIARAPAPQRLRVAA